MTDRVLGPDSSLARHSVCLQNRCPSAAWNVHRRASWTARATFCTNVGTDPQEPGFTSSNPPRAGAPLPGGEPTADIINIWAPQASHRCGSPSPLCPAFPLLLPVSSRDTSLMSKGF